MDESALTPTAELSELINVPYRLRVLYARNVLAPGSTVLTEVLGPEPARLLVFIDDGLHQHWSDLPEQLERWAAAAQPAVELVGAHWVPGGEAVKNDPRFVDDVGDLCRRHGLCRHAWVAAIGGGAVLDAVGFAAAIVHRGLRHLRLPTTVLSQNDSGVGVKNGINRFGLKNFYGVFAPPRAVVCDLAFLQSLSDRVFRSGLAESVKVGVVKDADFLDFLERHAPALVARERLPTETAVTHTAKLHLSHIARGGDPFESGSSRPLDFGHWAAHKLEVMTDFELLHGEAVAIGMALDLRYAAAIGLLPDSAADRVIALLQQLQLPTSHPFLAARFDELAAGLTEFREHLGGDLTLAMPAPLGTQQDIHEVDLDLLRRLI